MAIEARPRTVAASTPAPGRSTGGTSLLVASGGGHLAELHALAPRLARPGQHHRWVTEDTPQARSLLDGQDVVWVPKVPPRGYRGLVRNLPAAWRLVRAEDVTEVVSTGAGIALAYLPLARALGLPAHFVESAARLDGPSMTGALLAKVPGIRRYRQALSWEGAGWEYRGTVFDGFTRSPVPVARRVRRVVVTVGTMPGYPFDRLLARLDRILTPDVDVLWQTGCASYVPRHGEARPMIPWRELDAAIAEADVVVAHAGVGSALQALVHEKYPILVPRRYAHGEHVDDHQTQVASDLHARGIALTTEVDALDGETLQRAATHAVVRLGAPPTFVLGDEAAGVTADEDRRVPA